MVDSADPQKPGRRWADMLDDRVIYDSPGEVVAAGGTAEDPIRPGLVFVRVLEIKARKNRLHLDLNPQDLEAEVAGLEERGARRVELGRTG